MERNTFSVGELDESGVDQSSLSLFLIITVKLKHATSIINTLQLQVSHHATPNLNSNKTLQPTPCTLMITFTVYTKNVQKREQSFLLSLRFAFRASAIGRYADSSRCLPRASSAAVFHHFELLVLWHQHVSALHQGPHSIFHIP